MKNKTKKRMLSILLCFVMIASLMPITVFAAQQEISTVVATSQDLNSIPVLYGLIKIPEFTITQGSPAYINASTSNLRWQKNVEGVWTNQDSGRFTPGEWRISTSLRLDDDGALQYDFAQSLTLKVNDDSWTVETPNNHGEYSIAWVYSPAFTIVDDPNVQPPVAVESVSMMLNGYTPGAAASSATVTTDANVTITVLGFLELIDDGNGAPQAQPVMGNFASGKVYAVALEIKAKPGYDISGLTMDKVSLDRAIMPMMGEFNSDEEVFAGICLLGDAMQYTVTFETNGGSAIQPVSVGAGLAAKEPTAPTRAYYAFAGWYSDEELTKPFDFANTPIIADTTLYAKWTPSPVGGMFLMTIDFNGGTSTIMPSSGEIPAGSEVYFETANTIENVVTPPSGKVFDAYEIDGVRYEHGDEYFVTQNFTLKFLWKDAPVTTYTVSFNANGGIGAMADINNILGDFELPSCEFTAPEGKMFKAWSVDGSEKNVGDTITVNTNTTVTAVWEDIPPMHICDIKPVKEVEASCSNAGKDAHYKCEGCGKFFEDENGRKEITDISSWGNQDKLDHEYSDLKSDKDNHWNECKCSDKKNIAKHTDDNNDGKCDVCRYDMGTKSEIKPEPKPETKPNTDTKSPQTGYYNLIVCLGALLIISGFGIKYSISKVR